MAYFEIYPTALALTSLIECFWIYQSDSKFVWSRVMPDGCADVIYQLPATKVSASKVGTQQAGSPLLIGTMTRPVTTQLLPAQVYVGIRFRPGGMATFLRTPLATLTDRVLFIDDRQPALGLPVQEQLTSKDSWSRRIQGLENYLLNSLHLTPSFESIQPVVNCILLEKGQTSLAQLSEVANLSPRQLERLFLQHVGITPKLLARIVRFRHVKSILDNPTDDSLMSIAFDNGYTDHAHLTKEFTAFAGLTPSAYRNRQ